MLHEAAYRNKLSVVQHLLDNKADIEALTTVSGEPCTCTYHVCCDVCTPITSNEG